MAFWVRQRETVPPKFSISLGTYNRPKKNWKESSCKIVRGRERRTWKKACCVLTYFDTFRNILMDFYGSHSLFAWMLSFIIIIMFYGFCFFRFIYPFIALLSIFWHFEMLRKKLILKRSVFTLKSTSPATPLCNQFFCPLGYRPKFWYMRLSLCASKIAFCS